MKEKHFEKVNVNNELKLRELVAALPPIVSNFLLE